MMTLYQKKNYLLIALFLNLFWVFPTCAGEAINVSHLDERISEVPYLELPDHAFELIQARRKAGFFNKIEYGCYQSLRSKKEWKFLLYGWLFLSFIFLAIFLLVKEWDIIFAVSLPYIAISSFMLPIAKVIYNTYKYPGFWFLTDKGILIVDGGTAPAIFFLNYHDILGVDNMPLPGKLSSINSFLRITTKEGVLLEYMPNLFANERVFAEFCMLLKQKLKEERSHAASEKRDVESSLTTYWKS